MSGMDPHPSPPTTGTGSGPAPLLTVGFDLDMTLIDSRPGIKATFEALSAETGTYIDAALTVTRLGPPLEQELAHWFPDERIAEMRERYRELYPAYAIEPTLAMPGAREAISAVRSAGCRAIVITAKHEPNAELHLRHLGIEPDAVIGWLWAEAKAEALREHGATVYVGDHTGDVRGAKTAAALSVALPTGPCDADELRAAGADVVLQGGLKEFPGWFSAHASAALAG
jgi:phosphoglycolate phosphatase